MNGSKAISQWLFICAAAVFLMALIGAVTRLTESGLSIVEWKPVAGIVPPLDDRDWQEAFDGYRQSPQYIKVNSGMDLQEFKRIYFWEWVHRFWGRVIGLVYLLPLLWFWRGLPRGKKPAFIGLLFLGGLQGAVGWIMVKSGLVDQPAVSHYRLAAHLMMAFLLYGCLLRLGLSFHFRPEADAGKLSPLRGMVRSTLVLAVLTMVWGAFVAGLDAGLLYNNFPMMGEHWIPPEMAAYRPFWRAFFEEPATVQFTHRLLAIATLVKIFLLVRRAHAFHAPGRIAVLFKTLLLAVLAQVTLGIATLLSHVNIALATAHQAGALLLLGILVWLLFEIPDIRPDTRKEK